MTETTPSGLAEWLHGFLAVETRPETVEQWVDRTSRAIQAEVPDVFRFDGLMEDIRDTIRDHWLAFLAEFAQPTFTFRMVQRGRDFAARAARLQIPLETLIRFYRIGLQSTWAYLTDVVGTLPAGQIDQAAVIIYFWDRASRWIDESITISVEVYQAERTRLVAGVDAHRFEIVQAVLDGAMDDARRISAGLGGYPVSAHHTALVLACEEDDAAARLERVAHDLARTVGAANPLVVRPGGRRLWVWLATRDPMCADLVVDAFRAADRGTTVVGVGTSAHGLRGFADSHREAQGALQVIGPRTGAKISCYADVELLVLLGCSAEVDRFVARTLGGLAGCDEGVQRIRETVTAFLAGAGSVDEASRRLCVHRNTIRYRLGQAEDLLGRPIGRIAPELSVALRHHDAFHVDAPLV